MRNAWGLGAAVLAAVLLAACSDNSSEGGSVDPSGARGTLIHNPPLRIASLTAADFVAELKASTAGQQLLQVASSGTMTLPCGVDFNYIQYGTVGGKGEATTSSGALMVPTGAGAQCGGPRPIVLYAHGTTTDRNYNIADITNTANAEGALVAAIFAAHGYIVVAPNYAGYDSSALKYHPYLNADQQSKEMIDALAAARKALGTLINPASDNGKLFISGYSEGGHVAMATERAMQAASMTFTAAAPMSGPYALEAFGDAVFLGNVDLGSTVFSPLLTTSYQQAYGNIYSATTDIYEPAYATGIDTLLPSTTPLSTLFAQGKLPQLTLFSSTPPSTPPQPSTGNLTLDGTLNALFPTITPPTTPAAQAPLFALGFGTTNLITNNYRWAYVADALANPDGAVPTATTGLPATNPGNTLRQAFKTNDMRTGWSPTHPTLLCGGNADPTVFYPVNTGTMAAVWAAEVTAGLVTVLDVDSAVTGPSDPFAAAKLGFQQAVAATKQAAINAGATDGGTMAVTTAYHGTLVPPFCAAAALGYFSAF